MPALTAPPRPLRVRLLCPAAPPGRGRLRNTLCCLIRHQHACRSLRTQADCNLLRQLHFTQQALADCCIVPYAGSPAGRQVTQADMDAAFAVEDEQPGDIYRPLVSSPGQDSSQAASTPPQHSQQPEQGREVPDSPWQDSAQPEAESQPAQSPSDRAAAPEALQAAAQQAQQAEEQPGASGQAASAAEPAQSLDAGHVSLSGAPSWAAEQRALHLSRSRSLGQAAAASTPRPPGGFAVEHAVCLLPHTGLCTDSCISAAPSSTLTCWQLMSEMKAAPLLPPAAPLLSTADGQHVGPAGLRCSPGCRHSAAGRRGGHGRGICCGRGGAQRRVPLNAFPG